MNDEATARIANALVAMTQQVSHANAGVLVTIAALEALIARSAQADEIRRDILARCGPSLEQLTSADESMRMIAEAIASHLQVLGIELPVPH